MINVLVVEDSPVIKELIVNAIDREKDLKVIGVAVNGIEAVDMVAKLKPDVITMDVNLPEMNGLDATKRIMETNPVPIIICSANFDPKDMQDTFSALSAGAAAVAEKPHSYGTKTFDVLASRLVNNIRLLSTIKVFKRTPVKVAPIDSLITRSLSKDDYIFNKKIRIIAIGASTGGPVVLEKILSHLPANFAIPIIAVQHISPGFTQGFCDWLAATAKVNVKLANDGEMIQPGTCYIAPDNYHCIVEKNMTISLLTTPSEHSAKPSVSVLFRSIAQNIGEKSIGILLTGMGKDGALELKLMKESGATTIIQDAESSIVYGMPGEALKIKAQSYIFTPEKILEYLHSLVNKPGKQ